MKRGYVPPTQTITRKEIACRVKSQDEAIEQIKKFLPNPSLVEVGQKSVARLESALPRSWYHSVFEDPDRCPLLLTDQLLPPGSLPDGSGPSWLDRMYGITLGMLDREAAEAYYAEFVENIKAHLAENPEGLVLSSHDNVRLFKDGDQFIVRKP